MPFEEIDAFGDFVGTQPLRQPDEADTPDFLTETVPAAFRQENIIGSMLSDTSNAFSDAEYDPDLDVWAEIKGTKYQEFPEDFAEVRNRDHLEAMKVDIDRELADREILAQAGGAGMVAMMGAGIFDLPTLLPGSVAIKTAKGGYSVLRTAGATAGAGALSATASEMALRASQEARTPAESISVIAGSAVLSGILGGALGATLGKSDIDRLAKKLEDNDFIIPGDDDFDPFVPGSIRSPASEPGPTKAPAAELKAVAARVSEIPREADPLDQTAAAVFRSLGRALPQRQMPEAVTNRDVLGAFQFLRNKEAGQTFGRQSLVVDLNETTYNRYVRQLGDADREFDEYLEVLRDQGGKVPNAIDLDRQGGAGPFRVSGVGAKEDLLAQGATFKAAIDDFESLQAKKVGSTADSDLVPLSEQKAMTEETRNRFESAINDLLKETGEAEPEIGIPSTGPKAVGAAALEDGATEALKSALGFEKAFAFQDPMLRLQVRGGEPSKRIVNEMAETPLTLDKNVKGFETASQGSQLGTPGSIEGRIRLWQFPLFESLRTVDDMFVQYRTGGANRIGKRLQIAVKDQFSTPTDLTYTQFKEEVAKAMRRGDSHAIPEVQQAARALRQNIFEPLKDEAIAAKLLPEEVDVNTALSYLSRVYNREKIIKERPAFKSKIVAWLKKETGEAEEGTALAGRSDAEIDERAEEIIDRILGTPDGRLPYDAYLDSARLEGARVTKAGPLRAREFNIPDEMIEDFLESDIEYLSRVYVRSVAPDIELAKRFGAVDMTDQIKEVAAHYNARATKAKTQKERKKLQDRKEADIRDIAAIRDRLRGTYSVPDDPNGIAYRSGQVIRSLNYLRLLGGMTISAIPDVSRLVMVHGLTNTFRDGLVPLMRNFKAVKLSGMETKMSGTALDMVLDSRAMQLADVFDNFGRLSKFERLVQAAANNFGVVSLMAPWNSALKQFAGLLSQTGMLRDIEAIAKGTATPKQIERLAAGGISETNARRIAAQFAKHGEKRDGVWLAQTADWDAGSREAIEAFRVALARDVDRTIVTPGQDRPLFMSRPLGQMLLQFKSFAVASMQRTVISGLQQRDMGVLNGAAMAFALGGMVHIIKQKQIGKDVQLDTDEQWMQFGVNAVDRSGLTGWLMDANSMMEKLTRGGVGLSRLTGKPVSRYAQRNLTGSLVGPTAGVLEDFARIAGAVTTGEFKQSDVRAIRRLMPYQNIFYVRKLFDEAQDNINAALGVQR